MERTNGVATMASASTTVMTSPSGIPRSCRREVDVVCIGSSPPIPAAVNTNNTATPPRSLTFEPPSFPDTLLPSFLPLFPRESAEPKHLAPPVGRRTTRSKPYRSFLGGYGFVLRLESGGRYEGWRPGKEE